MLREFRTDLHVHTCLSPCADLRLSPRNIVAQAHKKQIDVVAICDHNSAENAPAVIKASKGEDLVVLPGMEICTKEEIHILAIFGKPESDLELQWLIYKHLGGVNKPEVFGMQVVANEFDEVLGFQERLLIGAVDLSIEEVTNAIHRLSGLAIASHIDRESYSVIGQLGFIPKALRLDALEISPNISIEDARARFPDYSNHPFMRNSDAHFIDDVGRCKTEYLIEQPSFAEIAKALRQEDGRRIVE
jgi:PHP family Zn ribbon phosphoesterase